MAALLNRDILVRRVENEARVVFIHPYDVSFIQACKALKLRGLLAFGESPIIVPGVVYKAWYADIEKLNEETYGKFKMLVRDFYTSDARSKFDALFQGFNTEATKATVLNPSKGLEASREDVEALVAKYKNTGSPLEFHGSLHQAEGVVLFKASTQKTDGTKGVINADEPRMGKGHPHGTNILTPTGWCLVENIAIGDYVIGSLGKPVRVTAVFHRGVLPVFRVAFNDGSSVLTDVDHLWSTRTKSQRRDGQERSLKTTGQLSKMGAYTFCDIPLVSPVQFDTRRTTLPIHPYILGVLLGDGGIKRGCEFTSADPEISRRVRKLLPAGTRLREVSSTSSGAAKKYCIVSTGNGRPNGGNAVRNALKRLELFGKGSEEKSIPEDYKFSSPEDRLELLRGLMDTDGWAIKKDSRTAFSSSSPQLTADVRFLVESLGGIAKQTVKKSYLYGVRKRDAHILSIGMPAGMVPFNLKRKVTAFPPRKKFMPHRIFRSVTPEGEAPVICISVDAADQLYVTEYCIVTHNTRQSVVGAMECGFKNILVVTTKTAKTAVWPDQIKVCDRDATIFLADHKKYSKRARWTITHWDCLRLCDEEFFANARTFDLIILDEMHYCSNASSGRSVATAKLCEQIPWVWGLTGTPVTKRPRNLVHLLQLIKHPLVNTGSKVWKFLTRYCGEQDEWGHWDFNRAKHLDELRALLQDVLIRRERSQTNLPPKLRFPQVVHLTPEQRKAYDHAWEDYLAIPGNMEKAAQPGYPTAMVQTMVNRHAVAMLKVPIIVDWAEDLLVAGKKVVIFTCFDDVFEAYLKHFGKTAVGIRGKVSPEQRALAVKRFQTDPTVQVFIGNIVAAKEAIPLWAADDLAFNDISWIPGDQLQAEDRIVGGTKTSCFITFFLAEDTSDQHGFADFIKHKNITQRIVNSRDEEGKVIDPGFVGELPVARATEGGKGNADGILAKLAKLIDTNSLKPADLVFGESVMDQYLNKGSLSDKQTSAVKRILTRYKDRLAVLGVD